MRSGPGVLGAKESSDKSAAGRAFRGRLEAVSIIAQAHALQLTVQGGVHAADIDQQTHHGHVDGGGALRQQLVLKDLAAFAALGHRIEVYVGESVARGAVGNLVEDAGLVIEDVTQEVVLDVLAPERHAIFLLQVADLVARVYRGDAAVSIAARGRGGGGIHGLLVGGLGFGVVGGIVVVLGGLASFGLDGRGRVRHVLVGRIGGEDVSKAVPRIGLVGPRC